MGRLRYLTSEIASALHHADSQIGAARLLGMSGGALRKRCLKETTLRALFMRKSAGIGGWKSRAMRNRAKP